jgi:hypothetical protein
LKSFAGGFIERGCGNAAKQKIRLLIILLLRLAACNFRTTMAEILDELTVGGEFQDRIAGLRAGDIHIGLIVGEDGVFRLRPSRHHIGLAPRFEQVTGSIEFQYCRCGAATFRLTFCDRILLEIAWPVEDPDMVIFVHEQTGNAAERPVVRQRLRPIGIIFVVWRPFSRRRGGARADDG